MARTKVKTTTLTKKNRDPNKPKRTLSRTRLKVEHQPVDLKAYARRRLVVRR